ncbi:conserved exported hypothetical protein [Burkholderia sp. 8Y]|uniref:hypothetical protein n=1 Tax=Burkholderia sp. 8Y TaxID=2653133 RepID=UPI0012F01567|nr:hypothetical protein [Burkholderia sp. 8Y]VXB30239.1 conserved exported hypothetical protein [Burkholderia sp. 8Y]
MIHSLKGAGTAFAFATALAMAACAPLPDQQKNADAAAAASAAQAAQAASAAAAAKAAAAASGPTEQRIAVGGASGYHVTVKTTPPAQVCDNTAFADGVRYGYALTWNRLVGEAIRENGGKPVKGKLGKFDPSAIHSEDDQYKIQWNGKERTNACASDGYLIGRIVGTHLAGVDMRNGKPS